MVRPPPPPAPPPPSRETDIAFGVILILCGIGLAIFLTYVPTLINRYRDPASKPAVTTSLQTTPPGSDEKAEGLLPEATQSSATRIPMTTLRPFKA
jgi:hypothetical protein